MQNKFVYLLLMLGVLVLIVFQDALHAYNKQHSFYIEESLLFSVFWMIFFPMAWFVDKAMLYKRFVVVILLACCIHVILFAFVVYALSALFLNHIYSFTHNLQYSIANDVYKCILVYSVLVFWYVRILPTPKKANENQMINLPTSQFVEKILVSSGKINITVQVEEIRYISSASPYITLHTKDRQYLHTDTLKSMEKQLNPQEFVRIHKTTIVNVNKVLSYKSRLNGDYDVLLDNGQEVRLSRNYVAGFKKLSS